MPPCTPYNCPSSFFHRRDKYQKKIKEYWVDTHTHGSYEKEHGEELNETVSAEGEAGDDITMGGINPDEPLDSSDRGDDDESDDESDDSDRRGGKGARAKGGRGKGSGGNQKTELEEEAALEAALHIPAFQYVDASIWYVYMFISILDSRGRRIPVYLL